MLLKRLLPPNFPIAWWLPYSWLAYVSLFVVFAILRGGGPVWWTAHGVGLLAFLVLYFRGFWLEGRALAPVLGAILAIGMGFLPWNGGASVFFVYAGSFACDVGPAKVATRVLVGIVLIAAAEAWLFQLHLSTWLPAVVLPLMIGGGNIAFTEKRRADDRLRLAQDEVAHLAKVAERERIAHDLHDLLGHTLSVIVLKSELASKLADRDPSRAINEIRDVERISRQALGEVRRAVEGYRQLSLEDSLAGVRQALAAAGVRLDEHVESVALSAEIEAVASLVLREAVTNVVRHAKATTCRIQMAAVDDMVAIEVTDDGVGGVGRPGTGLASMRMRVEEAGGRFSHEGSSGTRLRVELPRRGSLSGGRRDIRQVTA